MRFLELSHLIEDGMPSYPGLPAPRIGPWMDHDQSRPRYQDLAAFYISRFEFVGNLGTYMDSPFHRHAEGDDLSRIPLDRLANLPGLALDGHGFRAVNVDCPDQDLTGRAVLICTGWDQRWGTHRYWEPGPYLSPELLDRLVAAQPALVGVDFWNVDDTDDPSRPAHTRLLAANILIVEHMAGLDALPRDGFRFFAVPPRITRGASFPVRAFAELP